jgi:hypothetical protein
LSYWGHCVKGIVVCSKCNAIEAVSHNPWVQTCHVDVNMTVMCGLTDAGTPKTATAAPARSSLPAATPGVALTSTPGASAQAAAAAAAPSSTLVPSIDFSKFCFSNALSDVVLVAGDSSFPAHR